MNGTSYWFYDVMNYLTFLAIPLGRALNFNLPKVEKRSMNRDWREFFRLTVYKETLQGPRPFFRSVLKVFEEFTIEELMMREFEDLNLTVNEKKLFSLALRKIWIRHDYFKTAEFDRIAENFARLISSEKEQLLTFSTHAGGIYLFQNLLKYVPSLAKDKKLICYTSELPLKIIEQEIPPSSSIHFILKPGQGTFFINFPTLWHKSYLIDLSEVREA